ncbi:tryptophan-rich sensory protein, partial [Chromohalobacter beijerinckii]
MQAFSTRHQVLGLIGWLVVSFITAGIGAIASVDATQFYAELTQPSWAPPAGAFGPV